MLGIRLVPVDPFIGRLPANRIPLGKLGHRPLASQPVRDERHALIHRAGLRPGHPSSVPDRPAQLLPMYPVYSVTDLSGSDPPCPLPPAPAPCRLPCPLLYSPLRRAWRVPFTMTRHGGRGGGVHDPSNRIFIRTNSTRGSARIRRGACESWRRGDRRRVAWR